MRTVIVADDLTGACDTAISMKPMDEHAYVCLQGLPRSHVGDEAGIWALNTNSRPLTASAAYDAVYQLVAKLREQQRQGVSLYKKIDSLFRGNVTAELEAAAAAWKTPLVLLAPATPSQGRRILGGRLLASALNGGEMDLLPVLDAGGGSAFQNVSVEEVRRGELFLAGYLRGLCQQGCSRLLVDGETQEDLAITAKAVRALGDDVVLAGTSGFAAALRQTRARILPREEPTPTCVPPLIFVLGSCHTVTSTQCARFLELPGTAAVWISAENCLREHDSQEVEAAYKQCEEFLQAGVSALVLATDSLKTGKREEFGDAGGNGEISNKEITRTLGGVIRRLLPRHRFGAVVLSGGDTAYEILQSCGADGMELLCELLPGIPLARIRPESGGELLVVTKSGSFGETETFEQIYELLSKAGSKQEAI